MAKKRSFFWLIFVSLLLFFSDYFGYIGSWKDSLEKLFIPIKKNIYQVRLLTINTLGALSLFPRYIEVIEERDKLKRENDQLSYRLKAKEEENKQLRVQLEAPLPANYKYIPAPVIGVDRYLQIGVGEEDNVAKGMSAVIGDLYVGKVVSVTKNRSFIILPTDPESKIPIKTSRGARGVAVGQTGKDIILDKVLQREPLFLDDMVATSGDEDFPVGLLIGKVKHITTSDVAVYKQASIEPSIDYYKEKFVFIIYSK